MHRQLDHRYRGMANKKLTFLLEASFPDSTLRGDAEQGDNNQIQVALVLYLSNRGNNRREAVVAG